MPNAISGDTGKLQGQLGSETFRIPSLPFLTLCPWLGGGTGLTRLSWAASVALSRVSVNPFRVHSLTPAVFPERFLFAGRGACSGLSSSPWPAAPTPLAEARSGRAAALPAAIVPPLRPPPGPRPPGEDTLRQNTRESWSASSRSLGGKAQRVAFQASLATERGFLRRLERLAMSSLYRCEDCVRITFMFSHTAFSTSWY